VELNKRVLIGAGGTFIIAALYPLGILLELGLDGVRWIQNDPAYNFFVLLILPLSVGIFLRIFDLKPLGSLAGKARMIFIGLLVVMELFAVLLAVPQTLRGPPAPPHLFAHVDLHRAIALDRSLRQCVEYPEAQPPCDPPGCGQFAQALTSATGEHRTALVLACYQAAGIKTAFTSYADFLSTGSLSGYVSTFFNIFSGMFVILVFWYMVLLVVARGPRSAPKVDSLIVVYGLMLIWFPARLYSEWYIDYYSLAHLTNYFAFWFLLVTALLALPLLVLLFKPGRPVLIFSTLNGVIIALFGLLNLFRPELMGDIARGFESMPFRYFAAFAVLVFVVLAAMIFAMLPADVDSGQASGP
jgi:hypothetical protein